MCDASAEASGPAITQLVARASALGLVGCERTPSGRRTNNVTLTPEGHRTIEHNIEELIGTNAPSSPA